MKGRYKQVQDRAHEAAGSDVRLRYDLYMYFSSSVHFRLKFSEPFALNSGTVTASDQVAVATCLQLPSCAPDPTEICLPPFAVYLLIPQVALHCLGNTLQHTFQSASIVAGRLQVWILLLLLGIALVIATKEVVEVAEIAVDPDVGKNTPEIIAARGYDVETHKVTTSDGYILTLHRLPKSYDESQLGTAAAANKPAVLLQHGVIESSFAWVCNYRNQSLAFVLADAGYDVWLGNSRGNTYSNESLNYTTDDDKFWDFSWEDVGLYDLPAMINYVQDTSGRSTLSYIGHSQGVTQALVGFSANQTLAMSVSYFGAMAPVSWLRNSKAELFVALANAHLDLLYQALGIVEFLPHNDLLTKFLAGYTCTAIDEICGSSISLLFGTTTSLNISHVPVLISQTPAGTSVKDVAHFAQGIRDDTFSRYDYGCSCVQALGLSLCSIAICKNKAKYGSFEPPAFSLGDMVYPRTGLYVGAGDTLTESADLNRLRSSLPSGTVVHDQIIDIYSHLDFIWAYNANEYVYQDLIAQIAEYEGVGY